MKELIAIRPSAIGQHEVNTVNARDLHAFLGVGKDFSNWIKKQIERARLVENRDYLVFAQKGENIEGGRPTTEYHLTLEAGKHIAMLSGTDKGFEVREYFLECEKVAKQPSKSLQQVLSDPAAMRDLLLTYTEKVLSLESTVAEQAPKVEALDRISTAEGMLNITNAAKTLQIHPNQKLFRYMQEHMWIYRRAGGKNYVGYQQRIQQGLLSHKVTTVQTSDGREKIIEQVLVTPKGLAKLASVFSEARA